MTLSYSVNGSKTFTYEYDHNNRLERVWSGNGVINALKMVYAYDALGRRIVANPEGWSGLGTYYYYDGLNEVVEYDQNTDRLRYYVHGLSYIDERLMMYSEEEEQPFYYLIDNMKTTTTPTRSRMTTGTRSPARRSPRPSATWATPSCGRAGCASRSIRHRIRGGTYDIVIRDGGVSRSGRPHAVERLRETKMPGRR